MTQNSHNDLIFRKPTLTDGFAIYQLVKSSPPLDLNSSYLYFLQASHFADSCIVVEHNGQIAGFMSAYLQPDSPHSLFVWQIAVAEDLRGRGLASAMLLALIKNQPKQSVITEITCTISPTNTASQNLFRSFARKQGLTLDSAPFINESLFGNEAHEAEDLYTLKTADNKKLIPYLS